MVSQPCWPSEFSDLKKLEEILQCQICYEYINTCMITPCSHNFCSLCIRQYLVFKTRCPICFEETHGSDLRKNRLIDDVITIWTKVKDQMRFNLRLVTLTQSIKVESKACSGVKTPNGTPKKEMITPKAEKNKKVVQKLFSEKKVSPYEDVMPIVIDGITIPSIFQPQKSPKKSLPKKSEDMSTCPVCNVDVPLRNVNMHLDSCLAASDPPSCSRSKLVVEKREPLPKRVYTMMKEKEIKKYLKDYGLNINGDRKTMISRLSRYIVLYNAECDKEEPRPVLEIIKQVEREEKDEKLTASNPLFQSVRPPTLPPEKKKDPVAIEKANKEYLELNKDNFRKLIEAMRERDGRNIKPSRALNRINSDEELEPIPSTSTAGPDRTASLYSQVTVADSDSDPDMFEKTPTKIEDEVDGPRRIDWERTHLKDPEIDTENIKQEVPVGDLNEGPLEDDDNSYESVFNASIRSESAKTPRSSNKLRQESITPSTSKIREKFDEIFEHANGDVIKPGCSNETNGITDEEDTEDEDGASSILSTPTKNANISPEISPMKTRSRNKRKCDNSEEKTPQCGARATRRKRMRPISPEY